MEDVKIIITDDGILIFPPKGVVWMTEYEIAELFEVFRSKIKANIQAILKSGALRKEEICKEVTIKNGFIEMYSLEMITALAFRINSHNSEVFRKCLLKRIIMTCSIVDYKNTIPMDIYCLN